MKRLLVIAVLLAVPAAAFSHPGKTDRHGGHRCIKGCEEWGLYYKEYHLHDKYGKPVRIAAGMKEVMPPPVRSEATETAAPPVVSTQTVTVFRTITTVREENVIFSNPLLWVLIVLLLLFLILRRTRSQSVKR